MLTLKILAGVLQMHSPDATVRSDNQGIDALLGPIREQIAEGAVADVVNDPDATEVLYVPAKNSGGGGGGGDGDRNRGGGSGGNSGGGKSFDKNPGGGVSGGGKGGGATAKKPKEPAPFARTIFRKGDYGKSVYGPQYRRIDL